MVLACAAPAPIAKVIAKSAARAIFLSMASPCGVVVELEDALRSDAASAAPQGATGGPWGNGGKTGT